MVMSTHKSIRVSRIFGPLMLVLLIMLAGKAFAQPDKGFDKDKQEKFKALKVAYLTSKLDLTTKEAEKFWPIYNEYEEAKFALFSEIHNSKGKGMEDVSSMSDAEANKMLDDFLSIKQKEVDLEKKYFTKFRQVLPPKKVAMLLSADHDFKREVLKHMRDRNDGGPGGPDGPGGPPPHDH